MFCPKCGVEIPDDVKMCAACGAEFDKEENLSEDAVGTQEPKEASAPACEQTPAEEILVEQEGEESVFAEPSFEEPVKKKNKKKRRIITAIISGVVVVALALLVIFNFALIKGYFIKWFGTDEQYFMYVEYQNVTEKADTASLMYGNFVHILKEYNASESDVTVDIGDEILAALEANTEMDFAWLKKINLNSTAAFKDAKYTANTKVNVGGETLLDLDSVYDIENLDFYFAVANLSDKYLVVDGNSPEFENDVDSETLEAISNILKDPKLKDSFPSEQEFNELLKKYAKIAVYGIDNVSMDKTTLNAGDLEKKVTCLEFEFTEENAAEILLALLKELKESGDAKKYLENFESIVKENLPEINGSLYGSFEEMLDEAIEKLENGEFDDDKVIFELTDYLNRKHEIIGRKLEVDGEEKFEYFTLSKRKKYAFKFKAGDFEVEGEGTDKKDIVNGEYTLYFDGQKIAKAEIKDFDREKFEEEGLLDLNLTFKPKKKLIKEILSETPYKSKTSMITMLDPELVLDIETAKSSCKMSIDIICNNDSYLGIDMQTKYKHKDSVEVPALKDSISHKNIEEWVKSLDFKALGTALQKADAPAMLSLAVKFGLSEAVDEYFNSIDN